MKATVTRTFLADEAKWVTRVIDTRASDVAMAGLTLTAEADRLTLDAYSYEGHHQARVPAEIGEDGRVVVPGLPFATLLQMLRGKDVELATEGSDLVLRRGSSAAVFRQLVDTGVTWTRPKPETWVEVDPEHLADACTRLVPFARRNADPNDAGWQDAIRLTSSPEMLVVFAGTRYALAQTFLPAKANADLDVLAPARTLQAATAGTGGRMGLYQQAGTLYLAESSGREAGLRCYDLDLPRNLGELLAPGQPWSGHWAVNREAWLDSLKLVATASDRARLQFSPSELVVSSGTPSKGEPHREVTDLLECIGEANGTATGLAALEYLVPALHAITSETVQVAQLKPGALQLYLYDNTTTVVFQLISPRT